MASIKLVYFGIRGFAEPIRWMFNIAGEPFEDERIPLDAWAIAKKRNSIDNQSALQPPVEKGKKRKSMDNAAANRFAEHVGQLPILYIDDYVLTQTHTVTRFVARRYGFSGNSPEEESRADEICELLFDLRQCAVAYNGCFSSETPDIMRHTVFRDFYNEPEHEKKEFMRKELLEIHFPNFFSKFASILEKSTGKYITGENLTYADLALANFFDIVEDLVDPNCLDNYSSLKTLKEEILSIPQVKACLKSQIDNESVNPEGG